MLVNKDLNNKDKSKVLGKNGNIKGRSDERKDRIIVILMKELVVCRNF